MTSPSSATRYHPWLSESPRTVSPGISTAESSAFGLRRLRTWVHVRATSTRPVSAAAAGRRRSSASRPADPPTAGQSKQPGGRRLLAGGRLRRSLLQPDPAQGHQDGQKPQDHRSRLERAEVEARVVRHGGVGQLPAAPWAPGGDAEGPFATFVTVSVGRAHHSCSGQSWIRNSRLPRWVALEGSSVRSGDRGGIGRYGRRGRGASRVPAEGELARLAPVPGAGGRNSSLRARQ